VRKRKSKQKTQARLPVSHRPDLPHSTEISTPQTLQHALLDAIWRLPVWLRYALTIAAVAVGGTFAVWVSLPDKAKQETVDLIARGLSTREVSIIDQNVARRLVLARGVSRSIEQVRNALVEFHTTLGVIEIELLPDIAPNHARNFLQLAEVGLYDGTRFHRVMPGFAIVGGDPNTVSDDRTRWGLGGAIGTLRPEFSSTFHERGIVSMARARNVNSASSQFFICLSRQPVLDREYTVFGRVNKGMDVVERIAAGARDAKDQPYDPVRIVSSVVRVRTQR